jgi:hypothetical protein
VSQQLVSLVELGRMGEVDLETLRRVASALDATVDLAPRWRGPELARLLDADHAALVDLAVAALTADGWEVRVEWSFNHFGERGSIDILGWKAAERALAVCEVKSRVVEIADLHLGVDRKVRIAGDLVPATLGWRPLTRGALLILPAEPTTYDAIRRHAATFDASFPARTTDVRRWLRDPVGPLRGIWFVAPTSHIGVPASAPTSRRRRVNVPRSSP